MTTRNTKSPVNKPKVNKGPVAQSDLVKLPDSMPEAWLAQLEVTIKKDRWKTFWTTVLGSSVIAAGITGFTNYRLESYKKQASFELEEFKKGITVEVEKEKIRLQNRNEELSNRKTAYSNLKTNFQQFDFDLKQYLLACEAASKSGGTKNFVEYSKGRLEILIKQMETLTTSPKPGALKEIDDKVDAVLELVNVKVINADAVNDYDKINGLYEKDIQPKVKEVMQLFEEKEKSLVL